MGNFTIFFFKPSKKYCPPRLPSRHPLEFQGDVFFFNHSAPGKTKYQHTYEDPVSTVPEQSSMFFLQESNEVDSLLTSRTSYVIVRAPPYVQLPTDVATRTRFFFGSQVTCFGSNLYRHIKTSTSLFYKEVSKQRWYQERPTYCA